MSKSDCEHALSRVLTYLSLLGMPTDREMSVVALQLIVDALQSDESDIFNYVMKQLPQRFSLPPVALPSIAPPINRGSIGYGDHS